MLYRAFDAGVDKVEAIIAEEGIDCDFKRVGKLKLAAKPRALREARALAGTAGAARSIPDTRMVPRADLRTEIGSDRYFGGLLFEKSAGMHVGKFGQGLAEAAARRGALIYENNPVTGLRRLAGQAHEVRTPHGQRQGTPGAARHRHLRGGSARLVSQAHRAGRCVHHRH